MEQAQYAVSMAYRIRFVMQMTAREAMHLIELRSQPAGHPVYRRVAQQMHRLIADVHPAIGLTFVIVVRHFDLSFPGIASLGAMTLGWLIATGTPLPAAGKCPLCYFMI